MLRQQYICGYFPLQPQVRRGPEENCEALGVEATVLARSAQSRLIDIFALDLLLLLLRSRR